jgi:hypothetical protein
LNVKRLSPAAIAEEAEAMAEAVVDVTEGVDDGKAGVELLLGEALWADVP